MNYIDLIQKSKIHKIFKPFYSGIGHVLMFHRVSNDNEYNITKGLQVSTGYMESVLEFFISSKIDIVSLDECYNRIKAKGKMKRFVSFTFDDGYADNLTHALPVFEKYNAPFSVFLATGYPDHTVVLWWYLLENLVMENEKIEFKDSSGIYVFNTLTLAEKTDALWKIRRYILESNQEDLLSRLKTVFHDKNIDFFELTKKMALSWDQVIELSNHPLVTIGAHTVNHLALSKLSENKVIEEIIDSIKIIEEKIGKPVLYFAYPIGTAAEASEREFNIAKNCNAKMAFTAVKGNIFKYHSEQLHSLPRIGINERLKIPNIDLYINGLTPFRDSFL